jgi:hypothetical protein
MEKRNFRIVNTFNHWSSSFMTLVGAIKRNEGAPIHEIIIDRNGEKWSFFRGKFRSESEIQRMEEYYYGE